MEDQALHHLMEDLLPIVVIPVMTIAFAWVISRIIGAFQQRAHLRAQTDYHNKMLEKFASAEEFTAYLQSDAGKTFFDKLSVEAANPLGKILSSVQKGTILTLLGFGLCVLGKFFIAPERANIMLIIGTVGLTIGIGFIVSAIVSYRLAKTWGLISMDKKQIPSQPSSTVA